MSNIMLVEKEIVRDEKTIGNIIDDYSTNITAHLKLILAKIDQVMKVFRGFIGKF